MSPTKKTWKVSLKRADCSLAMEALDARVSCMRASTAAQCVLSPLFSPSSHPCPSLLPSPPLPTCPQPCTSSPADSLPVKGRGTVGVLSAGVFSYQGIVLHVFFFPVHRACLQRSRLRLAQAQLFPVPVQQAQEGQEVSKEVERCGVSPSSGGRVRKGLEGSREGGSQWEEEKRGEGEGRSGGGMGGREVE